MPFTLFCHESAPEIALAFFEERNAVIKGDESNWDASYIFPGKLLQKKKTITFNYDRQWCSPPNWPTQIQGMQNFVSDFELDAERRDAVMRLVRQFKFCIGIVNEPEISAGDDPRLDVMHALAEHMGGVFFTPGALLDSHFRPFASSDGQFEPDAILPDVGEATGTTDDTSDEELPAPEPPTAERIARRMYVLLALAARGLLDMNLEMGNEPAYRLDELQHWLEALEIDDEFEPQERQIVYSAERELARQDTINSVWHLEGLVVLAWALQLAELPAYDQLVETDNLLSALSLLDITMSQHKLAHPNLRSPNQLQTYNDQIFAFNWRLVDFRVRPEAIDYANVDFGYGKFDLSWATLKKSDLSLQGTPIAKADQELVQTMNSAAVERHKASNWLQGYGRLYSDVSTDT